MANGRTRRGDFWHEVCETVGYGSSKEGKQPPFPEQAQETPGVEAKMQPAPDYGEKTYRGHDRLEGRVALITGGDSGIGRAVALAFAREGADIAIGYLSEREREDAELVGSSVENAGRRALLRQGDLSRPVECKKLVDSTTKEFGRIDILINNAAYQGKAVEQFEELDDERVRYTFAVNQ